MIMTSPNALQLICSLEVQNEYRLGEPIVVTCRLHNNGSAAVWALRWNTFLEGMSGHFIRLSLHGSAIPYNGISAHRQPPVADHYVQIAAGQSVAGSVDLTTAYPIRAPGDYQIRIQLYLQDAFDSGVPPRPMQEHRPIVLKSDETVMRVVPFKQPLLTDAERWHPRSSNVEETAVATGGYPDTPTKPIVIDADPVQTQAIYAAHNWAYQSVLQSLNNLPPNTYATWFGTAPGPTINAVYNKIAAAMSSSQRITYSLFDIPGKCRWWWNAYTLNSYTPVTIYLCERFFSSWGLTTSPQDQAETVVHEMSHAVAGTEDYAYGQWLCQKLAASDPEEAAENADSYGLCAMEVAPEPPVNDGEWLDDSSFHDSTTVRPAAAGSTANGTIMMIYQDTNTSNPWLWFRVCTLPNTWTDSATIHNNATNDKCKTSVGPALAVANGNYYCVYVDGDPDSPTSGCLVYINTTNPQATAWTQPGVVVGSNVTSKSPALAYLTSPNGAGTFYCVYLDSTSTLNVVSGTFANDGSLKWSPPAQVGPNKAPYQSSVEPGLGAYEGWLVCMYADITTGVLKYTETRNGTVWSPEAALSDSQTSSGVALVQWDLPEANTLMCLFRGYQSDTHLSYILYTYDSQHPIWTQEYVLSNHLSSNGPALAGAGATLYAIYKGGDDNHLYWASTKPASQIQAADEIRRLAAKKPAGG